MKSLADISTGKGHQRRELMARRADGTGSTLHRTLNAPNRQESAKQSTGRHHGEVPTLQMCCWEGSGHQDMGSTHEASPKATAAAQGVSGSPEAKGLYLSCHTSCTMLLAGRTLTETSKFISTDLHHNHPKNPTSPTPKLILFQVKIPNPKSTFSVAS